MATFMSSAYTAADRRKKVVTYGKSSRPPLVPAPAPSNDAPSPERPRKLAAASNGALKKTGGAAQVGNASSRARLDSPDVFDVPSDDDFAVKSSRPTKKLPTKRLPPSHDTNIQSSGSGSLVSGRQASKAQLAQNAKSTTALAFVEKKERKPAPAAPIAPVARRGKTPQATQQATKGYPQEEAIGHIPVKAKGSSRATTPAAPAQSTHKPTIGNSKTLPKLASGKARATKPVELDVFDLPSSDDEVQAPTPKPLRRVAVNKQNELKEFTKKPNEASNEARPNDNTESDGSNTSNKRKRKGSVSSVTTSRPVLEQKAESSLPQRSRKYPKNENSASPGHVLLQPSVTSTTVPTSQSSLPAINKPKRTRLRTVPVITQPTIAKGHSSPVTLTSMLPRQSAMQPSPLVDMAENDAPADDTMYDIPQPTTTPARPASSATPGSVTPRQKALFGSLLGTSSASTTPMPNISKLQLTASKPRSLLGALSRSKSDVTHNGQSKKTRLIGNLKHAESSSEDESESDSEDTSEEEEGSRELTKAVPTKSTGLPHAHNATTNDTDVTMEATADPQTSQTTSGYGARSKFTYAKSRSYLQELNPEDSLLMSMDLDDNIGFSTQKNESIEEDDDEPSQVRANHELKRQGQQDTIDSEMLIDDISAKSTAAIRRSAMLEFCTKLSQEGFAQQLLDSTLAQRFLKNMSSSGEIIFEFGVVAATIFMLRTHPTYTMLDQIYRSDSTRVILKLLDDTRDIQRISKDRKTNLSKIAQESVGTFRVLIRDSSMWTKQKPLVVSPQVVSLKALEYQVLELRRADNIDEVIGQETATKLVKIALSASNNSRAGKGTEQDRLCLKLVLSILEAASSVKQKQQVWPAQTLQQLAESMSVVFEGDDNATIMLAVKLCMHLTNNKPKASQQFSDVTFVRSLVQAIVQRFEHLQATLTDEKRTEVNDSLILSLGAMINLTEHCDQARVHVDDGKQLLDKLVNTFVEGSARAAQVSGCSVGIVCEARANAV